MREKVRIAIVVGFAVLLASGTSSAHHSFSGAGFDGSRAVILQGVIVSVDWVNPHSWIFVEARGENGQTERWALEGPSVIQLGRRNVDMTNFKAGDLIQACGYALRDGVGAAIPSSASRGTGRVMSAELLTLPSGEKLVWSNYGQRKCLDQGSR